ncbi:HAD-like domain-containing protein [Mortierella sp. GBAus27b]|nr:HAD-like domain-containing protein [Mortierella sp. GBAus27b]
MTQKPTLAGRYKAVFFDIGGVVVGSPFSGIAAYEKQHNLPVNYLNVAIMRAGSSGAFQKLERGEIDLWAFYDAFSEQLSDPLNVPAYAKYAQLRGKEFNEKDFKTPTINGRELFHQMMGQAAVVVAPMVHAIAALRDSGYIVAALTNNFNYPSDEQGQREQELILQSTPQTVPTTGAIGSNSGPLIMGQDQLKTLFNHYIESAILGLRKPDPKIYKKACEIVGVQPSEVVFLDDIGANLKSAQNVGFTTIRVELGKPEKAIGELEQVLGGGIKLLSSESKL